MTYSINKFKPSFLMSKREKANKEMANKVIAILSERQLICDNLLDRKIMVLFFIAFDIPVFKYTKRFLDIRTFPNLRWVSGQITGTLYKYNTITIEQFANEILPNSEDTNGK